jgi:hypothetical protein
MKNGILLLIILGSFTFMGCDKVKEPYNEIEVSKPDTSGPSIRLRKVLIEDFTGHKCPNCPRASVEIKSLTQLRPGRFIPIGVHVTNQFASPGSGIYNIDFRTLVGNSNDSLFGVSTLGLPTGMVNRLKINGIRRIEYTKWGQYADSLISLPALAYITIENSYASATRTLTTTLKSDFLTDTLTGTYKLAVYLIEDSIPHAQKDNLIPSPSNDSDYVHNHVLRGSVNGTFGELLNTGPVTSTTSITKTYTRVLPATWREKKCAVVAFIYNDNTKEVLQAEEHKIFE